MNDAARYGYFRLCPRGFANEYLYFRVPLDKKAECETVFAGYEDRHPGGSAGWSTSPRARKPGVAIEWADRAYVGIFE